ncbi:hypothetical protein MASR2M17_14460 [Aminivibrio sp.]
MGAAFIMAKSWPFLLPGGPSALIPALIFGTVFTVVHCRAKVLNLSGSLGDTLPKMGFLLKQSWLFPLGVLIYFMIIAQYSVMKAAVYSSRHPGRRGPEEKNELAQFHRSL